MGTGLSEETRRAILRELQAAERKTCPFVPVPTPRDHFGELRIDLPPRWVKPTLVVDVEFRDRTSDGLRHAALQGVRLDKKAVKRIGLGFLTLKKRILGKSLE